VLLKMASDSEGLRPSAWTILLFQCFLLKMASDSEGLRLLSSLPGNLLLIRWKWLPIRKGYDLFVPPEDDNFHFKLKMASDSEGLRLSDDTGVLQRLVHRWKWLPIRKGYDNMHPRHVWNVPVLKMASDSEGLRPSNSSWGHYFVPSWKWLPIRKGYDFFYKCPTWNYSLKMASDSEGLRLGCTPPHPRFDLVENGFRFGRVTTTLLPWPSYL